jgi:hypothetical protein
MTITSLEPGNRIQLPAEWVAALGSPLAVVLDRTAEGILIRPCPPAAPNPQVTWDDFFATKLVIGSAPASQDDDELELTGDDFLF